jgi:multidrug efflux pump subunit AcrA (membrane-fusion protein)
VSGRLRPTRRSWALAGGAVALVAVGAAWAGGGRGGEGWREVTRGDLPVAVEVSGTLEAVHSVRLGPPQVPETWNFKISYLAPEGERVTAGTPVIRFDTAELERKLLDARAEGETAARQLDKLRADLERRRADRRLELAEAESRLRRAEAEADVPADLVSGIDLAEARIDLELARREVASLAERLELLDRQDAAETAALADKRDRALARVAEAESWIERMTVRAPRAGTVVLVTGRRGDKKKVGDQVWMQERVVEIPDLERMRAEGEVDEVDGGRVEPGMPVALVLDAHPDATFHGRVAAVERVVTVRSAADRRKVMRIDVELDETDTVRMRPGMRFQGEIEVDRAAGALLAPAETVFVDAAGPVVYRRTLLGRGEPVRLEVGRRGAGWVEVTAGLAAGDRLATAPPDGAEVWR